MGGQWPTGASCTLMRSVDLTLWSSDKVDGIFGELEQQILREAHALIFIDIYLSKFFTELNHSYSLSLIFQKFVAPELVMITAISFVRINLLKLVTPTPHIFRPFFHTSVPKGVQKPNGLICMALGDNIVPTRPVLRRDAHVWGEGKNSSYCCKRTQRVSVCA